MPMPLVGNAAFDKEHTSGTCERRVYPSDIDVLAGCVPAQFACHCVSF